MQNNKDRNIARNKGQSECKKQGCEETKEGESKNFKCKQDEYRRWYVCICWLDDI
ncbi:hypothetical protein FA13DRAFT_1738751 [Coprinellus micaceus]|uniref:Uncharacterized protein n=1 Tax=Coprinellus micaceus TaxID=71717 RepID=A0A4Y7STK5_COPMI|nr:hypothetical protein FA13DRAFT_1738751 [Coprinellus micaceus]